MSCLEYIFKRFAAYSVHDARANSQLLLDGVCTTSQVHRHLKQKAGLNWNWGLVHALPNTLSSVLHSNPSSFCLGNQLQPKVATVSAVTCYKAHAGIAAQQHDCRLRVFLLFLPALKNWTCLAMTSVSSLVGPKVLP